VRAKSDPVSTKLDAVCGSVCFSFTKHQATQNERVLYSLLRIHRPSRVLEVGSGYTTMLISSALRRNRELGLGVADLTVVNPHPESGPPGHLDGASKVIRARIQDAGRAELSALQAGDVLFIDASHVLSIGSDVQYLIGEVVPRLAAGVLIHFHDVFFPFEYPRRWVMEEHRFWSEQYALQAFLAFNESFETLWSSSWMAAEHPSELARAFGPFEVHGGVPPSSLWLRRVR